MKKTLFLYFIIFIEGYVVLSTELLAIRQMLPVVGGGTDTTAIIIAAVLCPMALGYYVGGNFKTKSKKRIQSIRKSLLRNIFIATVILILGLSYILTQNLFKLTTSTLTVNHLYITALYAITFIILPVFLLSQTIPLISHYFGKKPLPSTTGKILFFSTMGSLLGATFSTLVLMPNIGVHQTTSVTIICLCLLYILLSKKKLSKSTATIFFLTLFSIYINSNKTMKVAGLIANNQYNAFQVVEFKNNKRLMKLNGAISAGYDEDNNAPFFDYMRYIETLFISPIQDKGSVRSILVIGAGGFTLGLNDSKNNYIFVDIDGDLKDLSEQYFLKKKLGHNKKFHALPARAFLQQAINQQQTFDLIVVDTYLGKKIPEHLITKEFFASTKKVLKQDGTVVFNMVSSASFKNDFTVTLDNTFRAVFPHLNRHVIGKFNSQNIEKFDNRNVMYSYFNRDYGDKTTIYTDDKNRVFYDTIRK